MSVLDVLEVPNIILNQTSVDVQLFDNDLKTFVNDLFETMHASKGIGLAAPQVGVLQRVFVCQLEKQRLVCVNPTLRLYGEKVESEEGCLSIPNMLATVDRYHCVEISAYDENGVSYTKSFKGMMAIVIQHEYDHLEGVLITDNPIKTQFCYDNNNLEEE